MDLISQFIVRYRKEYDFYLQACQFAMHELDWRFQSAGVRAIVSCRAKSPHRLESKIRQRNARKPYRSAEGIYDDIVDLAGVRVALYFPSDQDVVERILKSVFEIIDDPKEFPSGDTPAYEKRFSGYRATHYRARLSEGILGDSRKRYADAKLEIQVASVLMLAWAEVEHDLVYKPLQGKLSDDEYAILDELNGLVLAGEIALERLQRAGKHRVSESGRVYTNHYDLAASLIELARDKLSDHEVLVSTLGRVDSLFTLLSKLGLNKREDVAGYVSLLHSDVERRPVADQIIDLVLAEDSSRYKVVEEIRMADALARSSAKEKASRRTQSQAIGEFMELWIELEDLLQQSSDSHVENRSPVPAIPLMRQMKGVSEEVINHARSLRRFRNNLVHGRETPDLSRIRFQSKSLRELIVMLKNLKTD